MSEGGGTGQGVKRREVGSERYVVVCACSLARRRRRRRLGRRRRRRAWGTVARRTRCCALTALVVVGVVVVLVNPEFQPLCMVVYLFILFLPLNVIEFSLLLIVKL